MVERKRRTSGEKKKIIKSIGKSCISKDFLTEHYVKNKKTVNYIAKKFNFTIKKVNYWISKYELTRNHIITRNMNEVNGMWKGDNVSYVGLHNWVRRNKPKPEFCEKCRKGNNIEVANISGEYKRDINDFEWLCRSCHMKMDYISGVRKSPKGIKKHKYNLDKREIEKIYFEDKKTYKEIAKKFSCGISTIALIIQNSNKYIRNNNGN